MLGKGPTVVIGTNLDEQSDGVVRAGLELARQIGGQIYLVHAYSIPWLGDERVEAVHHAYESIEEALQSNLTEQVRRLAIAGHELLGDRIKSGPAHRVLAEAGQEAEASLLVVGASHRRTAGLGSTADRILRKAAWPVLIVRGSMPVPPTRILAPTDLSELSADAFRTGADILADVDVEQQFRIVFVLEPLERIGSLQFTPEQIERFCGSEVERFRTSQNVAGLKINSVIRHGRPRDQILAELEEWPTDVVVMGTHGRSGFERFVLGSLTAELLRHAPCSVLAVPPAAAAVDYGPRERAHQTPEAETSSGARTGRAGGSGLSQVATPRTRW